MGNGNSGQGTGDRGREGRDRKTVEMWRREARKSGNSNSNDGKEKIENME